MRHAYLLKYNLLFKNSKKLKSIMLKENVVQVVRESFAKLAPNNNRFTRVFYDRLFEIDPSLRLLFLRGIKDQREKFYKMLDYIVRKLDDPKNLESELRNLGMRHRHYGIKREHYATFFGSFIYTLSAALGKDFTLEVRRCWCELCEYIGALMNEEICNERQALVEKVKQEIQEKDLLEARRQESEIS